MITIKSLTKKYNKKTVLNNVSFNVKKGDIVGIIGSNGAGKSTLVSIIANIIKPSSGSVTVDQGSIGYIPQEITVFPNLTVKENLNFWDTISNNHSRAKRCENINNIVTITNLSTCLNKRVNQLSGGLKRRVNIAVSLLSNPDILIMDEPTVGMDIESRSEIVDFIKKLSNYGHTIIYISHYPDEIHYLCNQLICLNKGNLVFDGTMDMLKNKFPHETDINKLILKISNEDTRGQVF